METKKEHEPPTSLSPRTSLALPLDFNEMRVDPTYHLTLRDAVHVRAFPSCSRSLCGECSHNVAGEAYQCERRVTYKATDRLNLLQPTYNRCRLPEKHPPIKHSYTPVYLV